VWPDGTKHWETYFGLTSAQAGAQAKASGARVLQVETSSAPPESHGLLQWASKFNTQVRTRSFDLLLFSQELLSLLNAGLNLVESVEALAAKAQAGSERSTLRALEEQLHRGQKFSQVLEAQPHIFPPVYVASIRARSLRGRARSRVLLRAVDPGS
jgi:general secretion pathway protein F